MSDDEYYAASPYDEYEDYFDDESVLGLADDLAQHTTHSPIWQENPSRELEPYHSDWEYYSDDYYDDDPALLRSRAPAEGALEPRTRKREPSLRRGRKRKLDEAREGDVDVERRSLASSIKGTVWAKQEPDSTAVYKEGEQEKVALLVNWRDVFRGTTGKARTFGRGQLHKDESWAKDMSLAAMGLHSKHRYLEGGHYNTTNHEHEQILDDDTDSMGAGVSDQGESDVSEDPSNEEGDSHEPSSFGSAPSMANPEQDSQRCPPKAPAQSSASRSGTALSRDHASSSKRRKHLGLPSPPVSNDTDLDTTTKHRGIRDEETSISSLAHIVTQVAPEAKTRFQGSNQVREEPALQSTSRNRKRKKSAESTTSSFADEDNGRQTRSKRVAMSEKEHGHLTSAQNSHERSQKPHRRT